MDPIVPDGQKTFVPRPLGRGAIEQTPSEIDGRLNPFEQSGSWVGIGRGPIERRGPLHALEASDPLQDLGKGVRGFSLAEQQHLVADSSDGLRARQPPDAPTRVVRIDETTVATGEFDDCLARTRQALPKRRRRNLQDARRLRPFDLQNLSEDLRQTMRTIETGEQRIHATDIHLFE